MKEDTIENINRDLLLKMVDKFEFLGVFFCKYEFESKSILKRNLFYTKNKLRVQLFHRF